MTKRIIFNSIKENITPNSNEVYDLYIINACDTTQKSGKAVDNVDLTVNLNNPNSAVNVYQIGIADKNYEINTKITINHNAPECKSVIISKYILKDSDTKTFWQGNVIINYGAKNTDTFEENRNLILDSGAKALSEPNLEIFEGDNIQAKHASSSTRPDDEEMFYIMSRGINKSEAHKLLIDGFINSVIDKMDITDNERKDI